MARAEHARGGALAALGSLSELADLAGSCLSSAARTGRFLRSLAEFRVRPDDVFISSYPRSGTTWLQQILTVLAHDGEPEAAHISQVSPWFERRLALGLSSAEDYARLSSPRIFKSHLPYAWLPRGARYVYAVRDGRDVAVSYYHLYRSHLGFEGSFDAFFERFMRGELQYGSWFKHVEGWRAHVERGEALVVEYERLVRELPAVMAELSSRLGFERSDARIEELARLCSFEHMKAHEHRFDHATEERALRGMATGQFIRRGGSGSHSDVLGPAQLQRFEDERRRRHPLAGVELRLQDFLH